MLHRRNLWDVWEMVRNRWKKIRRELHPDVTGGSYEPFAVMSAIYGMIMKRLRERGVYVG